MNFIKSIFMIQLWLVYTLLSALFIGVRDVLVKKFIGKNIHPTQIIFEQYFVMILVVLILFSFDIDFSSFFEIWDLYLLKAISLGLFVYIYFLLLEKFEISKISPLMNLSPMFLLIMTSVFLGEFISFNQFIGIVVIIVSTYILEINIKLHHKKYPHVHYFYWLKSVDKRTIVLVFAMLFIISITAISDKMIFNEGVNIYTNMYFSALIIVLFISFYYIYNRKLLEVFKFIKDEPETLLISVFAVISTFFVLLALAMPTAMVSLIVPIKRTSTLFSSIFGGLLFHENHLLKKFLAIIGMIIGVVLIVL